MKELFKLADNNMYWEKLLEARDFITEGHAIQSFSLPLGRAIGLSERTIQDIKLLTQFHDIGKVGVPNNILFKPGTLTPEEILIMHRHCEIGHRIAHSSPDLVHIADWIF